MVEHRTNNHGVRVEKDGDKWRVCLSGWGSFTVVERNTAGLIFDMAVKAYSAGREDAFRDLRDLIGAEYGR